MPSRTGVLQSLRREAAVAAAEAAVSPPTSTRGKHTQRSTFLPILVRQKAGGWGGGVVVGCVSYHTPWTDFRSSITPRRKGDSQKKRYVLGKLSTRRFRNATSRRHLHCFLMQSILTVKIGPRGRVSSATYGMYYGMQYGMYYGTYYGMNHGMKPVEFSRYSLPRDFSPPYEMRPVYAQA